VASARGAAGHNGSPPFNLGERPGATIPAPGAALAIKRAAGIVLLAFWNATTAAQREPFPQ
jgi:hypothetical protein